MCGPLGRGIHMSFILSRRAVCPHVSLQKQRILQRHISLLKLADNFVKSRDRLFKAL